MSKALLLGAAAMVGTTAIAVTSYVSPTSPSYTDVPAIIIAMPQERVLSKLQSMTAENYFLQLVGEDDPIPDFIIPSTDRVAADRVRFSVKLWNDIIVEVDANVSAQPDGQTSVDIQARLPDSQFSRSEALHPYDLQALASVADLFVTDYVDSVLRGKRMASQQEMEREVTRRLAFSEDQIKDFAKRVETVFGQAYAEEIRAEKANDDDGTYPGIDGSADYAEYADPYDNGEAIAEGAEAAAATAREAADAAGAAAAAAGEAASRAADRARSMAEY
jgi:hypothetical protein